MSEMAHSPRQTHTPDDPRKATRIDGYIPNGSDRHTTHIDPGDSHPKAELKDGDPHTRYGYFYVPGLFPNRPSTWPPLGTLREEVVEKVKQAPLLEVPPSPDHPEIVSSQSLLDMLMTDMESISPEVREVARANGERLIKRYDRLVEHDPIIAPGEEVSSYERQISYAATAACHSLANDIMLARERNSGNNQGPNTLLEAYELLLIADWIHERSLEALGKKPGDRLDDDTRDYDLVGEQAFYDEIILIKEKILGSDPESIAKDDRELEIALGHTAAWIADYREEAGKNPNREQAYTHLAVEVRTGYVDEVGRVSDWIDDQRKKSKGALPTREYAHAQLDGQGLRDTVNKVYDSLDSTDFSNVKGFADKLGFVADWVRNYTASGHVTPTRATAHSRLREQGLDEAIDEFYKMVTREKINRAIFDTVYDEASSSRTVLRVQQSYMQDMQQVTGWMAEHDTGEKPDRRDAHLQFDGKGLGPMVDELYDGIDRRKRIRAEMKPELDAVMTWMRDYRDNSGEWPPREEAYKRLNIRLRPAIDMIYDEKGSSNIDIARDHESDMRAVAGWIKSYTDRHGRIPSRTTAHSHLNSRGLSEAVNIFYLSTNAYHARHIANAARIADQHTQEIESPDSAADKVPVLSH